MPSYFNLLAFSLLIFRVDALPTAATSATSSTSANGKVGDPIPTATGPTCIQTRPPDDPSASDINAAIEEDDSITKACDVASQGTTTSDKGLLALSVIYCGHKNYFFDSSHAANIVSRPIVSPKLCPKTFHDIFSTCFIDQKFWGGWVMSGGTNRSSESSTSRSYSFRFARYTEHSIARSPSLSDFHVRARYWMYFAIS
ncbi:MAG: hypothetical protein Q9199_000426 [Rusavskia elegans]